MFFDFTFCLPPYLRAICQGWNNLVADYISVRLGVISSVGVMCPMSPFDNVRAGVANSDKTLSSQLCKFSFNLMRLGMKVNTD